MIEALLVIISAIPISVGVLAGYRRGLRCLLTRVVARLPGWIAGGVVATILFEMGMFQPFGLFTPVAGGLVVFLLVVWTAGRWQRRDSHKTEQELGRATRVAGSAAGAVFGALVAVLLWLCLLAVDGLTTRPGSSHDAMSAEPRVDNLFHSLVRTANRGVIRHIPVVGSVGDEVEALSAILNSDATVRRRLAQELRWEGLAELESFRAIQRDLRLQQDIDRVARGNLWALYRLQRHPKIITFWKEPRVQEIIVGLRPSDLARRIESLKTDPGQTGKGR